MEDTTARPVGTGAAIMGLTGITIIITGTTRRPCSTGAGTGAGAAAWAA